MREAQLVAAQVKLETEPAPPNKKAKIQAKPKFGWVRRTQLRPGGSQEL